MFQVPDKFVSGAASTGFGAGLGLVPVCVLLAAAALLDAADLAAAFALAADFEVVGGTAKTSAAPNAVTIAVVANKKNDLWAVVCM